MTGSAVLLAVLLLAATHGASAGRALLAGNATALDSGTSTSTAQKAAPALNAPALQPASNASLRAGGKVQAEAVTIFDYLGAAVRQFLSTSQCIYGQNCGGGCSSSSYTDDLDFACYQHDQCVGYTKSKKCGFSSIPSCNSALASSALSIYAREKCVTTKWWQLWCSDTKKVKNAKVIGDSMNLINKLCPY